MIRTSVPEARLSTEAAVAAYKGLAAVEKAFRTFKGVDLQVRPIHHRLENRVRAHIFLCMLEYYLEWHMREALAPLLFQDEDPSAGAARRASVVGPAERSEAATGKVQRRRTADGLPTQGFRSLLRNLATLSQNRVNLAGVNFDQLTAPTPIQQRALELLQVTPAGKPVPSGRCVVTMPMRHRKQEGVHHPGCLQSQSVSLDGRPGLADRGATHQSRSTQVVLRTPHADGGEARGSHVTTGDDPEQ